MYDFETYDPARPRMVTSFKGNQKLIFQGYRYNIHHVVPTKGLKTWRCVCAKKLTSARSWCKGRAETWDNDSQGISKGEHNHPAEHEIAEQEYFKSQLILAAIANPNATLNDLIDEASTFMSKGVLFGSRDSLKKSLMQARKSAENGVFKLKNYKNSDPSRSNNNNNNTTTSNKNGHQQQQQQQQLQQQLAAAQNLLGQQSQLQQQQQQQHSGALKMPEKLKDLVDLKMFEQNGTMFSLISLAQQQQQRQLIQQQTEANNNNVGKSNGAKNNAAAAAAAAAAALLFNGASSVNAAGGYGDGDAAGDFGASTIASSASTLLSQFVSTAGAGYGSERGSNGASPSQPDCSAAAADFLLNSGFEMMMEGNPSKFPRLDASRMRTISGSPARSSGAFNDSGIGMSPPSAPFHQGPGRRRKNAASANFDVVSTGRPAGSGSSDGFQTPVRSNTPLSTGVVQHSLIQQQQKKKMARINNIFDKLSHKAAAAASSFIAMPAQHGPGTAHFANSFSLSSFVQGVGQAQNASQRNSPFSTASSAGGAVGAFDDGLSRGSSSTIFPHHSGSSPIVGFASAAPPPKQIANTVETQTDESFLAGRDGDSVRLSACIGRAADAASSCECRVITVCCCSEETCKRRKIAISSAGGRSSDTSPLATPASDDQDSELADMAEVDDVAESPKPPTLYDQPSAEADQDVSDDDDEKIVKSEVDGDPDETAADDGFDGDVDVDVVGEEADAADPALAIENVAKALADAVRTMDHKDREDSDDAASLELNLGDAGAKSEPTADD